jgi:hypothetical protein
MVEYRAYSVGDDGHFVGFEAFVCADDSEAIEKAKRLLDGRDVELWSGPRTKAASVGGLFHSPAIMRH